MTFLPFEWDGYSKWYAQMHRCDSKRCIPTKRHTTNDTGGTYPDKVVNGDLDKRMLSAMIPMAA